MIPATARRYLAKASRKRKPILVLCYKPAAGGEAGRQSWQPKASRPRSTSATSAVPAATGGLTVRHCLHRDRTCSSRWWPASFAGSTEGRFRRASTQAVLIDEGHDFEAARLKLAAQMVDPATNSLLLLYDDDAQSIYHDDVRSSSASRAWAFRHKAERRS